jgi:hypothetical protein
VIDGGRTISNLSSQKIIKYGSNVLLALEVNTENVIDHDLDQIGIVDLLGELCDHFRLRLLLVRTVQDVLYARYALGHILGNL